MEKVSNQNANSDLKELLEDVTLNEIHLSNENVRKWLLPFAIVRKKRKTQRWANLVCRAICMCSRPSCSDYMVNWLLFICCPGYSAVFICFSAARRKEGYWLRLQISLSDAQWIPLAINRWGSVFQRSKVKERHILMCVRKPFVVNADPYKVFVLGTRFSVSQKNGQFKAYCFKGKIKSGKR